METGILIWRELAGTAWGLLHWEGCICSILPQSPHGPIASFTSYLTAPENHVSRQLRFQMLIIIKTMIRIMNISVMTSYWMLLQARRYTSNITHKSSLILPETMVFIFLYWREGNHGTRRSFMLMCPFPCMCQTIATVRCAGFLLHISYLFVFILIRDSGKNE